MVGDNWNLGKRLMHKRRYIGITNKDQYRVSIDHSTKLRGNLIICEYSQEKGGQIVLLFLKDTFEDNSL